MEAAPNIPHENPSILPSGADQGFRAEADLAQGTRLDAELSRPELLHQLFERQAEVTPSNAALCFSDQCMTYAEVERRANQLARFLRNRRVGRGSAVGLLLPRSPELFVAMLAILKAGAAYVPLDSDSPSDRLAYILADCGVRMVVT